MGSDGPFSCSKLCHHGEPSLSLVWGGVSNSPLASNRSVLCPWLAFGITLGAPRGMGWVPMVRFSVVSYTLNASQL